jgi:hypothetical protein
MDEAKRALTRMETNEDRQLGNMVEWATRNPHKDCTLYALNVNERDRLRARLVSLLGEREPPTNILIVVQPDDYRAPVHVRVQ